MDENEAIREQFRNDLAAFESDDALLAEAREVSERVAEEEAWLEALMAECRYRNLQNA